MSFDVFFSFSTGLAKTIRVPRGTVAAIMAHVAAVEETLGLRTEQYLRNPPHWQRNDFAGIADKVLCETAEEHNAWVRRLWDNLAEWSKKSPKPSEPLSRRRASTFWHALEIIDVPLARWTEDYYRARMESIYEVLRGRPSEGMILDSTTVLTELQAAEVIGLFSQWLDRWDLRLDVPNGRDYLASSSDGGYVWCEKCGPVHPDDEKSCRRRGCPLRAERKAMDDDVQLRVDAISAPLLQAPRHDRFS